jgi:hypothetical protein
MDFPDQPGGDWRPVFASASGEFQGAILSAATDAVLRQLKFEPLHRAARPAPNRQVGLEIAPVIFDYITRRVGAIWL